jgi:CRP-like cAMP-binding protein
MLIHKALIKYGYENFSLEILEYCEIDKLIAREQFYFQNLKPQYNLLQTAGSSLGYKHSEETLAKMRENYNLKELNLKKIIQIQVFDILTQSIIVYDSLREAAKALGCSHSTILRILKEFQDTGLARPLKERYIINKITK